MAIDRQSFRAQIMKNAQSNDTKDRKRRAEDQARRDSARVPEEKPSAQERYDHHKARMDETSGSEARFHFRKYMEAREELAREH